MVWSRQLQTKNPKLFNMLNKKIVPLEHYLHGQFCLHDWLLADISNVCIKGEKYADDKPLFLSNFATLSNLHWD